MRLTRIRERSNPKAVQEQVKRIEAIVRKEGIPPEEESPGRLQSEADPRVVQRTPGPETPPAQLERLYEISKLLVAFESVEHTVLAVLAVINQVLPLRSAVLVEQRDGLLQLIAWHAQGLSRSDIDLAKDQAISTYRHFVGASPSSAEAEPEAIEAGTRLFHEESHVPTREDGKSPGRYIAIPMVTSTEPIFGVLQLEGRDPASESDFTFVNAAANQLAMALDHHYVHLKEIALRKRAEEMVRELDTFSYTVAHDLRAPLRTMNSFSQLLIADYAGKGLDETGQDYARRVAEAARRMDQFVRDLLEYTRLTRAQIPIERVDLRLVLTEVLKAMDHELAQRKAEVRVEEPLSSVIGHRPTLDQVLTNLLTNGAKFVAPGVLPRLRVWAELRNEWVRLWIEDNGIGIPEEQRTRIFGVFERLHKETEYPGTGIGLAIVKKAMERMGGRIGVESELGKGSRFWIELRKERRVSERAREPGPRRG